MTNLNHRPRPFYEFVRRALRAVPIIDKPLMKLVRGHRIRHAAALLEAGNFFPEERTAVLGDYAYSTIHTHRGIMQAAYL